MYLQNYDWFGFSHTTVQTSSGETLLVISAPAHRVCSQSVIIRGDGWPCHQGHGLLSCNRFNSDVCVCDRPDCSYNGTDIQAAGQVFIFRVPLRPVPDAILTGSEEFQQFGYTLSPGRFGNSNVLAITSLTRCKFTLWNVWILIGCRA